MLQLMMGTLLSAIFLLFQVLASPYKKLADDFLASSSSFGLVAVFLCSWAFKVCFVAKCPLNAFAPLRMLRFGVELLF